MKNKTVVQSLNVLLIAICISAVSCTSKEKPVDMGKGSNTAVQPDSSSRTELVSVSQRPLSSYIQLPGEFTPFEMVNIFPRVSGFVKSVNVDRGSVVKQGETLITLEAPEIDQQVQSSRAELAKARTIYLISRDKYERLLETSKTPGTVSPYDLANAKATMESDSANVDAFQSGLQAAMDMEDYLTVKAPFDGVITERNIHPGALVGPSVKSTDIPMLVLQQEDHLRLVVDVPETVSDNIISNGEVTFEINAMPNREFHANIVRRSGSINDNMRSEAIEMDVVTDGTIKPGMYAEVKIPLHTSSKTFVVPNNSIISSSKGNFVVSVDQNHKTHFINVDEGIVSGDSTQIFGNLQNAMKLVKSPSADIKENSVVN